MLVNEANETSSAAESAANGSGSPRLVHFLFPAGPATHAQPSAPERARVRPNSSDRRRPAPMLDTIYLTDRV